MDARTDSVTLVPPLKFMKRDSKHQMIPQGNPHKPMHKEIIEGLIPLTKPLSPCFRRTTLVGRLNDKTIAE